MGNRGGYRIRRDGRWLILAALLLALAAPSACNRVHKPPVPGAKSMPGRGPSRYSETDPAALKIYDSERPCLTAGQMFRADQALFEGYPRPDPERWLDAINDALYARDADCGDDDFLLLVLSTIQMESGVRADPPLAEPDLEALFVRRKEQLAGENLLAASLLTASSLDGDLRRKLRQDTLRGRVRSERDLARYMDGDLRPWLRDYLERNFLMPEGLAGKAEARWLPDPVKTIGPMQVNTLKAWRNAKARGEPIDSPEEMRRLLLTPDTALERGIDEGVALLLKSYRAYRPVLSAEDAVFYAGADYNAGEFSCRNAAYQEMLAAISGRRLSLDGDLLLYREGEPTEVPSRSELAAREALPSIDPARIRKDLLLEKEPDFGETATAQGICERYRQSTGKDCPAARVPAGADNPKADLKLGRAYTPENYARGLFAKYKRNRDRYVSSDFGL